MIDSLIACVKFTLMITPLAILTFLIIMLISYLLTIILTKGFSCLYDILCRLFNIKNNVQSRNVFIFGFTMLIVVAVIASVKY